jgi:hypothetical protein
MIVAYQEQNIMKKSFSLQSRKKLQKLMLEAFNNEINVLEPELQAILVDDMVTAFQNRLLVFQRFKNNTNF